MLFGFYEIGLLFQWLAMVNQCIEWRDQSRLQQQASNDVSL